MFHGRVAGRGFATETLAVGVNMPARSVVVEQLSGYRGQGYAQLTPGEYTQLTGRAGRRGIDEVGYAYTLWQPQMPLAETARLVASSEFELESSFRPTYNMIANLMARRTRDEAVELLQRSFAQWRASRRVQQWTAQLEDERAALRAARARVRALGGGRRRSGPHRSTRGRSTGSGHQRHNKFAQPHGHRIVREAERLADKTSAKVNHLKDQIKLAKGGLARQLDAIGRVLDTFGCADGWSLTPTGDCLAAVFHESDLLTVLCLRDGVFDDVAPPQLAGLVSVLTYEHRSSQPAPAPRYPDHDSRERTAHIFDLAAQIANAERTHGVPVSRSPDASFLATAYAWANGTPYADLHHGDVSGHQTPPAGDFVRQVRQLIDLVDRISDIALQPSTRRAAIVARLALDRGVVNAAKRVADVCVSTPVTPATNDGFAAMSVSTRIRRLS